MTSLKQQRETRRQLGALCGAAVQQQIESGSAQPSQLRQRRRHLLKALRKRLAKSAIRSPEKILHSALMVLALWGFGGLAFPNTAQASAVFEHVMLQGIDMGGNTAPVVVDIDNDGDMDLFAGNIDGTVKFYQNNGNASAANFVAADGVSVINPLAGFDVGASAAPAFADIDNDGDLDLFVGELTGTVKFYQNNGTAYAPSFVAADEVTVFNPMYGLSVTAGNGARPTLVDIDNDGDLDLFAGEGTGTVKLFRNNGNANTPNFTADAAGNPLAMIDLVSWSNPTFADIDNDGDFDAFVGNSSGVKFYRNDGTVSTPSFVAANGVSIINPLAGASPNNPAPFFSDIDNDGDLDAFISSSDGTLGFYRNDGTASVPNFVSASSGETAGLDVGWYSRPAFTDIDNDGDLDLFVGASGGTVNFYRNDGTTSTPNFVAADGSTIINPLAGISVYYYANPAFADIDNDGDLDLFVGEYGHSVKFYRNVGTPSSPLFSADAAGNPLAAVYVPNRNAYPAFADIDRDGDLDVFVGEYYSTIKFYRNDGTASTPNFVAADGVTVINPLAGVFSDNGDPTFVDIDGDGDLDAFMGENLGTVKFYQNNGNAYLPNFVAADGTTVINPLAGFGVGNAASPAFADIDYDGDLDAFVGNELGKVRFFENLAMQHPPIAENDNATTEEDTVLDSSVSLLDNDTDFDGDSLSALTGTFATTQGGSITINSDGSYSYTPPASFIGRDTVKYTVSDGSLVATGNLTITINAASSGSSSSGGGGGAFGLGMLWALLLSGVWRRRSA